MLDRFNREINYLRVSITDRCNLRCSYCRPKEGISLKGHDDILRYEEIIRIVSIAVKMGLVKIRITGGEPLFAGVSSNLCQAKKKLAACRISELQQTVFIGRIRQVFLSRY